MTDEVKIEIETGVFLFIDKLIYLLSYLQFWGIP